MEHALTIVALAEFHRGQPEEGSNVTPEALRRRVIEVIRDVRHRQPRVLEDPRGMGEARHRQVAFWRRQTGAKEAAHERAWYHVQLCSERTHAGSAWRRAEQGFEEPPAVLRDTG